MRAEMQTILGHLRETRPAFEGFLWTEWVEDTIDWYLNR